MRAPDARRRAVFLDRDGTLAPNVPYCRRIEDFRLYPDVGEAVRLPKEQEFLVVVVTNQSGLARGYFDRQTLHGIHDYMCREIAEHGGRIDAVYYCQHHPDDGCCCRKPRPGMLLQAGRELGVSLEDSFFVGDQESDVAAAHAAGCKAVLVEYGAADEDQQQGRMERTSRADRRAGSLLEAAGWIIKVSGHAVSR